MMGPPGDACLSSTTDDVCNPAKCNPRHIESEQPEARQQNVLDHRGSKASISGHRETPGLGLPLPSLIACELPNWHAPDLSGPVPVAECSLEHDAVDLEVARRVMS